MTKNKKITINIEKFYENWLKFNIYVIKNMLEIIIIFIFSTNKKLSFIKRFLLTAPGLRITALSSVMTE